MMTYYPIKFGRKNISRAVDMVQTVISDYVSPYCHFDLEDSAIIFRMSPWPVMVYHHTKFGYKGSPIY